MSRSDRKNGIDKAVELHQKGQLDLADQAYARILKRKPRNVDALHMRGVLKFQQGELKLAELLLKKSLTQSSQDRGIHTHLAQVLAADDRHESALHHFDQAIACGADDADVHFLRGNVLFDLGQYPEAVTSYQASLALQPRDADCQLNLANAYEALGDLHQAIDLLEPLVNSSGKSLPLQLQLIEFLVRAKMARRAHSILKDLAEPESTEFDQLLSVARLLHQHSRHDSVACLIEPLVARIKELTGRQFDTVIGLLNDLGRFECSQSLIEMHCSDDTRSAWSWFQQGLCAQSNGDFELAEHCHRTALQLDPTLGAAAYSLASNGNVEIDTDLIENWAEIQSNTALDTQRRAHFLFAVARTLDRQGKHEESFSAYQKANSLVSDSNTFDADAWDKNIGDIINAFSVRFFSEQRERLKIDELPNEYRGASLVFIVGMPRSGSTILEQLLVRNGGAIGLGEHQMLRNIHSDIEELTGFASKPPFSVLDLETIHLHEFRQRYLESVPSVPVSQTKAHVRYVDKMLGNFMRLGLLALMFPDARVLHCCRDPNAIGVSGYTNLFSSGLRFTYDLYDMGRATRAYLQLMEHWRAVLPLRIKDVQYEHLVADPDLYQEQIFDFLDLEGSACVSAGCHSGSINTASYWQARQPVSTASIAAWKRFDRHLGPLRKGLGHS